MDGAEEGENQDFTTWSRDFGDGSEHEGVRRRGGEEGEVEGAERSEERGRNVGEDTKADIMVDGREKGSCRRWKRTRREVGIDWKLQACAREFLLLKLDRGDSERRGSLIGTTVHLIWRTRTISPGLNPCRI